MAQTTSTMTLGTGRLWLDDVEVGYLKGDVEFVYTREKLDFKPSGSTTPVDQWVITEVAELRASIAEFNLVNLKQVLGLGGGAASSFSGVPSYNPASFDSDASNTFDFLTFGGGLSTPDLTVALRFEHTRAKSTDKIVIILYTAVSMSDLTLAFHEEDFLLTDVVFRGIASTTRPAGDKIGMIINEIAE